jgi:hypothetical protein
LTPAAFLQSYPEYADTSSNVIAAKLAQATARMGGPDFTVWPQFGTMEQPTLTDVAQGALCAHYLALSPFGTQMRLASKDGISVKTTYWTVWEECCDAVVGGFIVAGQVGFLPFPTTPGGTQYQTGYGSVSVVNGSANIVFSTVQSFPAGTIFNFLSQPGVPYALAANIVGQTSATLTVAYDGPTATQSSWSYQPV